MLNEWQEFQTYTGEVNYTAEDTRDVAYMRRFTFEMLLDFEGLVRVLTIIARGYLFHDREGNVLKGNPRERIDYARRALCAWCSVPDRKKPLLMIRISTQRKRRMQLSLRSCMGSSPSW